MITQSTLDFLKKLARNNSREWFNAHRELYDKALWNITDMTMFLIDEIAAFDETVAHVEPKDCIFRLLRDTRFSNDKTPYKTNFGIFIKKGGRRTVGAGYYLHIEPGNCMVSGGIYMPPAPQLAALRAAFADDPEPLRLILSVPAFKKEFGGLYGDTVKTAPRGYTKDHPALDLIRFKHYIVGKSVSESELVDKKFPAQCVRSFKVVKDFNQYLNRILER